MASQLPGAVANSETQPSVENESSKATIGDVFRGDLTLRLSVVLSCLLIVAAVSLAAVKPDFGCDQSFLSEQHLIQAWICGGAFGALLLHALNALTSRRMQRDPCTWYCLLILLNAAVRFFVPAIGRENLVCVIPLGGLGGAPRAYSVLTWVFWSVTAPPMIALLAALSGSCRQQKRAFAITALALACGSVGTFMQHIAAWAILLLIAFTSLAVVVYYMIGFARRGLARAQDRVARRLWLAMLPIGVGVWLIIPLVWLLGQLNAISMQVEVDFLSVVDFLVKLAYVILHIGERRMLGAAALREVGGQLAQCTADGLTQI